MFFWVLVLVIGVLLVFLALRTGHRGTVVTTSAGFAFVVLAAISGLAFLFGGGNSVFSLMMAVFFILGFFAYTFPLSEHLRSSSS
ncbi:MAG: hypothetical protein QW597_03965 [Thermoplasmataceae archaeon]